MSSSARPRSALGFVPVLTGQPTTMEDRRKLLELLAKHSYDFCPGKYILSSGKASDEYLDCKNALSLPQALWPLGRVIVSHLSPQVVAVGGLTMGADPIAVSASMASGDRLRWFLVRKEAKPHGMKKMVEGNVVSGEQIAIVDDVVTTGDSTIDAIKKAREYGRLIVAQVIVVVDREEEGGLQKVKDVAGSDVSVTALFAKSEIRREWDAQRALRRTA